MMGRGLISPVAILHDYLVIYLFRMECGMKALTEISD